MSDPAAGSQQQASPLLVLLARAMRLRCPNCGEGKLFAGWFRMHPRCSECGFKFERGPGYWLGSIYVNYGLAAILVTAGFFVLFFTEALPQETILWSLTAFCVIFPLLFFRFARSIWSAFDVYFDPVRAEELERPKQEQLRERVTG
jgi:uncharacterized protein (DUF983 family)